MLTDPASLAAAADDFGHIVHKTPSAILRPANSDDVVHAIQLARQYHGKVAPQGQSHSVWGRSMTDNSGGIVDVSSLHSVGAVQSDRVTVDAGAKWSEVLSATLAQGKTPPVLCDYLELSVGGTIVVGGVGGTTSRYGVQADNVISMEVVTGAGQRLTCSPSSNSDLFNAIRAGLGQVAIITKVTLKLIAAPASVRRFLLFYPSLAAMLQDARLLSGDNRFDAVQGAIVAPPPPATGWAYRLDCAKFFTGTAPNDAALLAGLHDVPAQRQLTTLSYFDYLNRLAALESALRANGQWFNPHPWLTTFIGDSHVESVVNGELGRTNPANDLGMFGQIVLSPLKKSAITSPLLRKPSDNLFYAFNFVRVPATADAANAQRLVTINRGIYDRVRAAGGALYPVSAFPMSKTDWRNHFGSEFGRLDTAKHRYDPSTLLTPGYEVF
ncbi:MAG TPA: FAD-binding protein [Actinophytocola sp.]|nr:FAD-binding protein [Actinophytocola sp.]